MSRRSSSVLRFSRVPSSRRVLSANDPPKKNRRSSSVAGVRREAPPTDPDFQYANRVMHTKKDLCSFREIQIPETVKDLDVSHNQITDFAGLGSLKQLESLNVSFNKIKNFSGFPYFTHLRSVNIVGNDVAKNMFARVALIILCPTLRVINGENIRPNEQRMAKEYKPEHAALLRAGWTIKYPAPSAADMAKIKKEIASEFASRNPVRVRNAPKVVAKPPRKQSEVYKDVISHQEAELKSITEQIDKLSRRQNK